MALIILEGLDRTGKSSVATHFETQGYELIHQSAPPKGQSADNYLEEQIALISSAATKNVVLDRSYYGELIWPQVYGRESLLTEDGLEALRELEESVGVTRILMQDPNVRAHWKRCVDNKEPMDKHQFVKARDLFAKMADKYGFTRKTLQDYPGLLAVQQVAPVVGATANVTDQPSPSNGHVSRTKEQIKLDTANAINDVLEKRILKPKGPIYDLLEQNIRVYLNNELAKIFGTKTNEQQQAAQQFSAEEVELLKFFCNKLTREGKK